MKTIQCAHPPHHHNGFLAYIHIYIYIYTLWSNSNIYIYIYIYVYIQRFNKTIIIVLHFDFYISSTD